MATAATELLLSDNRFTVIPMSLTGPEIAQESYAIGATSFELRRGWENNFADTARSLRSRYGRFMAVDFTHPTTVNRNAKLYRDNEVDFVMGTTGGDRIALTNLFAGGSYLTNAVIAPNMAKQVVMFQAMMRYAAERFPNAFAGYTLEIIESHQAGKADTSGTAKAMVGYFNALGIPFTADQIIMVRDIETQLDMGVPETDLAGHGFHTYTVRSADGKVLFRFTHDVCGRGVYAEGTRDALVFLKKAIDRGEKGRVFSMEDVLEG